MKLPDNGVIVCLDSSILAWGIDARGRTEMECRMTDKAIALLEVCRLRRLPLATSLVCFTEFLSIHSAELREALTEITQNDFALYPFDLPAAKLCAEIFYDNQSMLKSSYHGIRGILRPDLQIVASILTHCYSPFLVTGDGPLATWASKYLPASRLNELEL